MPWKLSRFRAGDHVEVLRKEEILATLDEHGCVDGMPFMPEMLQFCGRRFRVGAVAHKTCDTIYFSGGRRLQATVHLAGLRCDGSAHDGCQAECNLFWKDVWLKPVGDNRAVTNPVPPAGPDMARPGCSEAQLLANTFQRDAPAGSETRFACQATKVLEATEPLPWWDMRQYFFDVLTRNHSLGRVLRVLWIDALRRLMPIVPFGYRMVKALYDRSHRWLTGRTLPYFEGKIKRGTPTPTGRLDLQPGERVRIKSKEEIAATLDETGRNRGLTFDPEMVPYCNRVFQVRKVVTNIIDEPTGKMRHMKQPCIMLEGVVCNSEYIPCRLNCPRAVPSYWREIWLERAAAPAPNLETRRVELPLTNGSAKSSAAAFELARAHAVSEGR